MPRINGNGILAFQRIHGRQSITAILNFAQQRSDLDLRPLGLDAYPIDLLSGQTIDPGRISIAATSALLLTDANPT